MFHIIFAVTSRFLYFGNVLQVFARGIAALRSLGLISSRFIPAISPPPPIALLDSPVPFVGLRSYPSGGLIALERIERQPPPFASPIPSYQSSLITLSSSQLPIFLPLFIIALAVISGLLLLLPQVVDLFTNVAPRHISKLVRSKSLSQASNIIVTILQRCGLLAVHDTRTPPLLKAIYGQITRGAAGYDNLVDGSDISYVYVEDHVITDGSLRVDLAHDEIPENYRLRLQNIYTQFVKSQDLFREQLELSRAYQHDLHAEILAAERERERLVSTLEKSDKKRLGAKARCAEAELIVSKLRADLTAAMNHLDRQTEVASSKDHIIQSVTEESQVAHVRLKHAEDKITHLNAKLQRERDRRLRKTKELLDEQIRVEDGQSEIHRLKQEAQDVQEQLDTLRAMSRLHADIRSPSDHGHSARYLQPTTGQYDACQPPLPPERIYDTGTPPTSPAINVDSSTKSPFPPSQHQDPTSEVTQDHWAVLKKLFERMRQDESESADDAVKPNSEQQESRLQDELAVTKEQLCLAEEEVLTVRRELDQSREALREVMAHIASLQSEWEMFKAMLRETQYARRSSMTELAEVVEFLRVSQAKWEESQFRCSQATFLCAALQERVTELEEAKVKYPRSGPVLSLPVITPVHTESRPGTAPSGVEAITHEPMLQVSDSIYMTIPPLLPNILDFSLPISSSPFTSSSSLYLSAQKRSVISPIRTDTHSHPADTDSFICNTDPVVDPGSVNPGFTNLGHSLGSMDWSPIGSVLFPGCGDARQGREEDIGLQTEEDGTGRTDYPYPIPYALSPFQESEPVLDIDRKEVTHSLRKDRCSVANASPTSSSHRDVPIRPPHRSLLHPSKLPRLLDPATIDSPPDGTVQLRKGRRRPSLRRGFSLVIPKLEYDLPAGFVPGSGFTTCTTPKRQASGIDDFAYLIPLDCKTSTPVAARKRTLKRGLFGSGAVETSQVRPTSRISLPHQDAPVHTAIASSSLRASCLPARSPFSFD